MECGRNGGEPVPLGSSGPPQATSPQAGPDSDEAPSELDDATFEELAHAVPLPVYVELSAPQRRRQQQCPELLYVVMRSGRP